MDGMKWNEMNSHYFSSWNGDLLALMTTQLLSQKKLLGDPSAQIPLHISPCLRIRPAGPTTLSAHSIRLREYRLYSRWRGGERLTEHCL